MTPYELKHLLKRLNAVRKRLEALYSIERNAGDLVNASWHSAGHDTVLAMIAEVKLRLAAPLKTRRTPSSIEAIVCPGGAKDRDTLSAITTLAIAAASGVRRRA
jgi:hypothetical protein